MADEAFEVKQLKYNEVLLRVAQEQVKAEQQILYMLMVTEKMWFPGGMFCLN